jgi:L-alanine-DL-glutamate epimerase-like enolase superfamily enzyme
MTGRMTDAAIRRIAVSAYTVPTDAPEADGTATWDKTTLVLVEIEGGGSTGIGYTYADTATAQLIHSKLAPLLKGRSAFELPALWTPMGRAVRNLGRQGIASMAISAVDFAFWDLKAKLLGQSLVYLLGQAREKVAVYGSGGFTSYSSKQLTDQLGGWANQGIQRVKMKVGTHPERDVERVRTARNAIGPATALFVDANGAYSRKQALGLAERFLELGVSWFEEPVPADDLEGLHLLRNRLPSLMQVAAGEYGYEIGYFRRMLEKQAVDVLQADATRCGGFTGFLHAAAVCQAFMLPFSSHCAPAIHLPVCCATTADMLHMEYFHDHVRIEAMLFDGTSPPVDGELKPNLQRPGLGLEFKRADAEKYKEWAAES